MNVFSKDLYDALVEAGASEAKASAAAKDIAAVDKRFNKIEADLVVLKWMVGLVIVVEILPVLQGWFG